MRKRRRRRMHCKSKKLVNTLPMILMNNLKITNKKIKMMRRMNQTEVCCPVPPLLITKVKLQPTCSSI